MSNIRMEGDYMSLRKVGDPVAVTKSGGSYYVRIPIYVQRRIEMKHSLSTTVADCEAQWLEDTVTRKFSIRIEPKKAGTQ